MRAASVWMNAALSAALVFALSTAGAQAARHTHGMPSDITAAVKDSGRPETDTKRDVNRKPAEALAFAGVKPGDKVAELIPAAGYYTRMLSKIVGPSGHVYMLVPPTPKGPPANMRRPGGPGGPGAGAPGARRPPMMRRPSMMAMANAIAQNPEYSNVSVVQMEEGPAFRLPEQIDLFWTTENYHDLHNMPNADLSIFNKRVFESLKNGGTYFIEDHAAAAGAGTSETRTLHRIDPAAVKTEVTAAGFEFVGQSRALHNPKDNHKEIVFRMADKTDRFMFKFRKPQ
ncbi:MAG: class I SAM-dependent methyltransferase [Steroidobacteraceae bacterium]